MYKKKIIIILSTIMIVSLFLVGCGGSSSDSDINISEANNTYDQFESGIANNDENMVEETISSDGITLISEEGTDHLTKNEFTADIGSLGPETAILFNLNNKTTRTNGNKVIITGEMGMSLPTIGDMQVQSKLAVNNLKTTIPHYCLLKSISEKISLSNSNPTISTQNYNGTNFSIVYPDDWNTYSLYETSSEILLAIPDKQLILIALWLENAFSNDDLNDFTSDLIYILDELDESISTPRIDNLETTQKNITINSFDAKELIINYDLIYYPTIMEITLEKEGDSYYITQIEIRQSSSTETINIREKTHIIDKNDDLYFIEYGGNTNNFNSTQADEILNSFTF